jgi:DNA-directed RNA polymerase subunit M/transcription elongation factor TFIIS
MILTCFECGNFCFKHFKQMQSAQTRANSVFYALKAIIPPEKATDELNASAFADLKVKTGETSRPLFVPSLETMAELVELSAMITDWGLQESYDYLVTKVIPKLEELHESQTPQYSSVLIFNSPLTAVERQHEIIGASINSSLGPLTNITSCGRCGASKVHRKMAQTRSADEGTTAIFTCPDCGNQWQEG